MKRNTWLKLAAVAALAAGGFADAAEYAVVPGGTGVAYAPIGLAVAVPQRFSQYDLDGRGDFLRQFNIVATYAQVFHDAHRGNVAGKILVIRDRDSVAVAFYYPEGHRARGGNYILQGTPAVVPVYGTITVETHPNYGLPCVVLQIPNSAEQWRVYLRDGTVYREKFLAPRPAAVPPPPAPYWHRDVEPARHHRGKFDWRGLVSDVLEGTARAFH